MKLAIIAEDEIYQQSLRQAVSGLVEDVRTYAYDDKAYKADDYDVTLCVISKKTGEAALAISKGVECFGILEKDFSPMGEFKDNFLAVFSAPIRLGGIREAISSYIKQRKQKELLKPVALGEFLLDPRVNELKKKKQDSSTKLTEKEVDILLYLEKQKGQPVTRQDLLDHVWGYADGVETHTLETHIYRLRQKIEKDPTAPDFLITNDDGYCLNF